MKILITRHFFRQAKRLKKKFPNLKEDLIIALKKFDPGTEIHVGRAIYKIRIKSRDINKGKSGGLRTYIYLYRKKDLVVPICLYQKSEKSELSRGEIQYHFQKILREALGLAEGF